MTKQKILLFFLPSPVTVSHNSLPSLHGFHSLARAEVQPKRVPVDRSLATDGHETSSGIRETNQRRVGETPAQLRQQGIQNGLKSTASRSETKIREMD